MKRIIILITIFFGIFSFSINLHDIKFNDKENKEFFIKDVEKKSYIKIWGQYCPVCIATMDHTLELHNDKNKDFELFTIVIPGVKNERDLNKFRKWFNETDWKDLNNLTDENRKLPRTINLRAVPTNIFIDSKGEIVKVIPGVIPNKVIKEIMSKIK